MYLHRLFAVAHSCLLSLRIVPIGEEEAAASSAKSETEKPFLLLLLLQLFFIFFSSSSLLAITSSGRRMQIFKLAKRSAISKEILESKLRIMQ